MVMSPVVAPTGTVVVMEVASEAETTAEVPLNFTVGPLSKFVPVMVTVVPTAPLNGVKLVIVGVNKTVKLLALVSVTPLD